jgi:hypothetical protein
MTSGRRSLAACAERFGLDDNLLAYLIEESQSSTPAASWSWRTTLGACSPAEPTIAAGGLPIVQSRA